MTPNDLFATYPRITHATSWVELILFGDAHDGEPCAWEILIQGLPGLTPPGMVAQIKELLAEEVAENRPGKNREALAECDDPQFLTYIAGKMGAM